MGFINQIITRGHHLVSIIYIHENYPSYRWTVGYWCWSDGLLVKIDVSTEPPLDLAARPIGAECGWLFGSLLYRLGPCRRCAEDASDAWTARVGFANQIREFMKIGNNWPVLFCDPVYLSYFQALVSKHGRKSCENHGRKWTNHLWMDLGRLGHYFMYIHWSHWMVDFPASHGLHLLRKSHFFQCQVEAAGCTFPCLTSCIDNISLRHEFFHGMGQNHSNPINHSYIFIIVPIWLGESTFMFTFIFTIPDCFPWFFTSPGTFLMFLLRIFSRFSNSNFEITKEELPELLGHVAFSRRLTRRFVAMKSGWKNAPRSPLLFPGDGRSSKSNGSWWSWWEYWTSPYSSHYRPYT